MEFKTTNLVLAATLLCFGAQIKNIELNDRQGTFVLDGVTDNLLDNWQYKNLRVEPIAFHKWTRFLSESVGKLIHNR